MARTILIRGSRKEVKIELRLSKGLKVKAVKLASLVGADSVSNWLRLVIHERWETARREGKVK